MKQIDLESRVDVTSRLSKGQARKALSEIFNHDPNLVGFTKHSRNQMKERELATTDVLNVLKAGKMLENPEFENGSWRYKVQTAKITVVVAFRRPNHIVVVTAWRN
ncbi:MAG: DUF4258 domain-containing protein [Bacteriovoracaceae bacterium]|nr:DUF4258 domain-containing protein [Bacteriovoracaceae bacterium]